MSFDKPATGETGDWPALGSDGDAGAGEHAAEVDRAAVGLLFANAGVAVGSECRPVAGLARRWFVKAHA